jgi:hypothetical protein
MSQSPATGSQSGLPNPAKTADDNVPVPDPSLLTTQALQREIFSLRELLEVKLKGSDGSNAAVRTIIETRLDGMDKAIKLLQDTADKFPARIDEKIIALKEVHEEKFLALLETHTEKFTSIQLQFRERDVRSEQSSKDSKVAVDAALQAAKEAVGEQNKSSALAIAKSETATTKQIDQLAGLIQTMTKGFDDKFGDVKDRINRMEGKGVGLNAGWGYLAGGLGLILALYGALAPRGVDPTMAAILTELRENKAEKAAPQVLYVPSPPGTLLPTTPPTAPAR